MNTNFKPYVISTSIIDLQLDTAHRQSFHYLRGCTLHGLTFDVIRLYVSIFGANALQQLMERLNNENNA